LGSHCRDTKQRSTTSGPRALHAGKFSPRRSWRLICCFNREPATGTDADVPACGGWGEPSQMLHPAEVAALAGGSTATLARGCKRCFLEQIATCVVMAANIRYTSMVLHLLNCSSTRPLLRSAWLNYEWGRAGGPAGGSSLEPAARVSPTPKKRRRHPDNTIPSTSSIQRLA